MNKKIINRLTICDGRLTRGGLQELSDFNDNGLVKRLLVRF
ncbi:MAG: hypothetical protein ACFB14_26080 [Leptolyngbyaceae cyanobacterium]